MPRRSAPDKRPLVLVMVGLPARGKTYTARKMARYLTWRGRIARVFNVGNYRRHRLGANQPASFFDPDNREGLMARREIALSTLSDMLTWLMADGDVAIYDATNTTRERRQLVRGVCEKAGAQVVFVESVCDDEEVIERNIRQTKLSSPDYVKMDADKAVADFRARIAHYERAYEPIADPEASWVKIIDLGQRLVANRIYGYLPGQLVFFLMNMHTTPRTLWFTRHGQSAYNALGRIGGDSPLSKAGGIYALSLAEVLPTLSDAPKKVWTSTLQRTVATAKHIDLPKGTWKALDEIDAGVCDGMTYAEIKRSMPDEFAARSADKLRYRYPRGESYEDVVRRLDPVIIELERQRKPVLVVAHQAVLRALYGYFMGEARERVPHLSIPLHTLIELSPHAYGCHESRHPLAPGVGSSGSS